MMSPRSRPEEFFEDVDDELLRRAEAVPPLDITVSDGVIVFRDEDPECEEPVRVVQVHPESE